ncbi:hypothetical protein M011DRAFT_286357 [Sporormia fimetaria CBS 119925]|uniref:Uncharacterized protein n=1 Tax=Sporormia fimetaria CBS 119925 TaxID=1340428 RepID=A0A6A6VHC1_9PLEO|nr:hypothetical protein M011DRAFT_286357 [Sporormia fimetaria CBS 119925]
MSESATTDRCPTQRYSPNPTHWRVHINSDKLKRVMTAEFSTDFAEKQPVASLQLLARAGVMFRIHLPSPSEVNSTDEITKFVRDNSIFLVGVARSMQVLRIRLDEHSFVKLDELFELKWMALFNNSDEIEKAGLQNCYEDLEMSGWVEVEREADYELVGHREVVEDKLVQKLVELVPHHQSLEPCAEDLD